MVVEKCGVPLHKLQSVVLVARLFMLHGLHHFHAHQTVTIWHWHSHVKAEIFQHRMSMISTKTFRSYLDFPLNSKGFCNSAAKFTPRGTQAPRPGDFFWCAPHMLRKGRSTGSSQHMTSLSKCVFWCDKGLMRRHLPSLWPSQEFQSAGSEIISNWCTDFTVETILLFPQVPGTVFTSELLNSSLVTVPHEMW